MIKVENTYNLQRIQIEVDWIIKKQGWNSNQIALQSPDGEFKTGSDDELGLNSTNGENFKEKDFNKPNTPEHWEITKLIKDNNLYRTRLLLINPRACYSYHVDFTKRIHLAVTTHPHCFIIINEEIQHIPADGNAYLIDTTNPHTALNASLSHDRIHIVGCCK